MPATVAPSNKPIPRPPRVLPMPSPPPAPRKPRILVADDDARLTLALRLRLERDGYAYEVIVATDGYNALARTLESQPDVLVLDVHMPAGDAFSVQDRLAKATHRPPVPVIYITGDASSAATRDAVKHHATAVLHKPFGYDQLLSVIRRALDRRAA